MTKASGTNSVNLSDILKDGAYAVIDNLIPPSVADLTEQRLLNNPSFAWYAAFHRDDFATVGRGKWERFMESDAFLEGPQLVHPVIFRGKIVDAGEYRMIKSIQKAASAWLGNVDLRVDRCKYNLKLQLTGNRPGKFNCPHRDCRQDQLVMVYYVNDSDGSTYIFNNEELDLMAKIESRKGRAIIFRGDILHAGQHPIRSQVRAVMNFNFSLA